MITREKYLSAATMVFSLTALLSTLSVSAQPLPSNNSWLDRKLVNWNKPSSELPRLPSPSAATNLDRCKGSFRSPSSDSEKALANRGWKLFGKVQTSGKTKIVMATSGFDGMCRPVGYQHFVYVEDRYTGTLSPTLMDSRTDGALITARLVNPTKISAEFVRYTASDALCCPLRTSFVTYQIQPGKIPNLMATAVVTRKNS
jgi:LppP/LprE lipoprotein